MEHFLSSELFLYFKDFLASIGLAPRNLTNSWTALQILYFAASAVGARLIQNRLEEPINERLRQIEGQWALLRVLIILHRRSFWLILSIFLWIGFLVLHFQYQGCF